MKVKEAAEGKKKCEESSGGRSIGATVSNWLAAET